MQDLKEESKLVTHNDSADNCCDLPDLKIGEVCYNVTTVVVPYAVITRNPRNTVRLTKDDTEWTTLLGSLG